MSMQRVLGRVAPVAALWVSLAGPAGAQTSTVMSDLVGDVGEVREKLVGLARAMPEGTYDWRPGEGVRSVAEVFKHVAADNYLIPEIVGIEAPEGTGIDASNYQSAVSFEARSLTKDQVVAELDASFAHLTKAMGEAAKGDLSREVMLFGSKSTAQQVWILVTTHVHEHLGQAIAYARSNGVVPPWSR
jgi:uncharacterized damage-inducible protein DinB